MDFLPFDFRLNYYETTPPQIHKARSHSDLELERRICCKRNSKMKNNKNFISFGIRRDQNNFRIQSAKKPNNHLEYMLFDLDPNKKHKIDIFFPVY